MSIILGRLEEKVGFWEAAKMVLKGRNNPKAAVDTFLGLFKKHKGALVRAPGPHVSIFCPTGGGKFVSCVAPFLLSLGESERIESVVGIDFKAEMVKLVGKRLQQRGYDVHVLDPYGISGWPKASYNPLQFIQKDSKTGIDDCRDIAKALVVRQENEHQPYFNDGSEIFIGGMAAAAVQFGQGDYKSLQLVREALSHPVKMKEAMKAAQASTAWGGALSTIGYQLSQFSGETFASVISNTNRHMAWSNTPVMMECTKTSSFNPADFTKKKMAVFLVLPPDRIEAQKGWLRMVISSLMRAQFRNGPSDAVVYYEIDEAASLGELPAVTQAMQLGRSFSVNVHQYFQGISQLQKNFPKGGAEMVLSNTTKVFFCVNDVSTAEMIQKMAGKTTILVEDWNSSHGGSGSYAHGTGGRTVTDGTSWNKGESVKQYGRELIRLEEVMTAPKTTAFTFATGIAPIKTTLLYYYREPWLFKGRGKWGRRREAMSAFLRALLFFVWMCGAACILTKIAIETKALQRVDYFFQSLTKGVRK